MKTSDPERLAQAKLLNATQDEKEVRIEYRATNSFGAYVTPYKTCPAKDNTVLFKAAAID